MMKMPQLVPLFYRRKPARRVPAMSLGWALALLLGIAAPTAFGQALPAAEAAPVSTGFALPLTAGTLQYGVSASESLIWGYYGSSGAATSTNLTGDLAYISSSKRDPFSMIFSGGRLWSGSGQGSHSYLNLGLSQVINAGRWNVVISDSVSYLPGTPTTGLSGVAGVGDLGINPVQVGPPSGQGVLTDSSSQVSNSSSISIQRQLTGKTSINGSGFYGISRFLSTSGNPNAGLGSDSVSGSGGINHQFDVRNSLGANYVYSSYSFPQDTVGIAAPDFVSQTVSAQGVHQFTRRLGATASVGPQWTSISSTNTKLLSLFANVAASYSPGHSHISVGYVRSTNNGYGVTGGTTSDSVSGSISGSFGRVWSAAAYSAFTRSDNLPVPGVSPFSFHTTVTGFQISRAIARSFSCYGSYTLEKQSTAGPVVAVDVYSGLTQVVGFGLTFSPMPIHFGRL